MWSGQSSLSTPVPTPTAASFTSRQPELDDSMRCALLGWLSEVAAEYKMQTPTYFLCVRLLDTVLQQQPIRQSKFQLLGCACLMIAGKLEEMEVLFTPPPTTHYSLRHKICFITFSLTANFSMSFNFNRHFD